MNKIKEIMNFTKNVEPIKRTLEVTYHIDKNQLVLVDNEWIVDPDQLVVVEKIDLIEGNNEPIFICSTPDEPIQPTKTEFWEGIFKFMGMWFPKNPALIVIAYPKTESIN